MTLIRIDKEVSATKVEIHPYFLLAILRSFGIQDGDGDWSRCEHCELC